jgi:hypothetical protein
VKDRHDRRLGVPVSDVVFNALKVAHWCWQISLE